MSFRTALLGTVILLLPLFINRHSMANENSVRTVGSAEAQRGPISSTSSSRRTTNLISNPNADTVERMITRPKTTSLDIAATEQKIRRVLTALTCIGVVCLATVFAAKLYRLDVAPGKANQLLLISTMKIAPRCCLTLVSADGQKFLIARDAGGVKSVVPVQRDFDDYVSNKVDESAQATHPLDHQLL